MAGSWVGVHARAHEHEATVMAVQMRMLKEWRHEVVAVAVVAEASIHLVQQRAHGNKQQIQDVTDCPQ
jgi:hypothetical protein